MVLARVFFTARIHTSLTRAMSTAAAAAAPTPKSFRLALVQLGHTAADKTANLAHARELVLKAVAGGEGKRPDVVVLPECFNSPYGVKYFDKYAEPVPEPGASTEELEKSESIKVLSGLAKEAGVYLIGGSIPEREEGTGKLYNTATVYDAEGNMLAKHRKVHLFDIDVPGKITFKESDSLSAGTKLTVFDTKFGRIGLGICYDVRFPELAMIAARNGAMAMIYPSAFNTTTGPLHWELLQRARAVDNQIYVSMCSPARNMEAEYHAWGHSLVVDPMGTVIASTDEKESIIYADIDVDVLKSARTGIPVTTQRRFDVYPDVSA